MKNFEISLSKSLTERDSTYEICSSLLSLLGIEEGWIASPDASRSAERCDTSATDFEDSLPKSDMHNRQDMIRFPQIETIHCLLALRKLQQRIFLRHRA